MRSQPGVPGHVAQVAGPGLDHDRQGPEAPQLALHRPALEGLPAEVGVQRCVIGEPLRGQA